MRPLAALSGLGLALLVAPPAPAAGAIGSLEYLGRATLERGLEVDETTVGGLSALVFDTRRDVYYAVSDDPGRRGEPRFYEVAIDLADGRLDEGGARVLSVTLLRRKRGRPFPDRVLDGEGLVLTPKRRLLLSSEGHVRERVDPSFRRFGLDGRQRRRLPLPKKAVPGGGDRGIRHNEAFEALTLSPDGRTLYAGLESALAQDGPAADLENGSPVRILAMNPRSGRVRAEFVYVTDPVAAAPDPVDAFRLNGLVELLTVDERNLLALERSYSEGVGNRLRLFLVGLDGATDVRRFDSLVDVPSWRPVSKELLLDFDDLEIELDNFEGLTWGPRLADGRRTLLTVSDDNFNPEEQSTQFLAFAVGETPPTTSRIQGRSHRSPFEGRWVRGVEGVVTAVDSSERRPALWIQAAEGDGEPATSDGLAVTLHAAPDAKVGDRVRVTGRVVETGFGGEMTVTRLEATSVVVEESGVALPEPVRIAADGRGVPGGGEGGSPAESLERARAFWESLEGMRGSVPNAVVVGATTRFGGIVVLADGGATDGPRTSRGGVLARQDQLHLGRVAIASRLAADTPMAGVGDRFTEPVVGVVDYDFGHYRLLSSAPLPALDPTPERPAPVGADDEGAFTLASYNVLNLDAGDDEETFARLARSIVERLRSPDLLALQEVQDDSGSDDDGTVSAEGTLTRLIEAIATAGGPTYAFRQLDPPDNADGGQPGGNIRVAFLFDPDRVGFTDRPAADGSPEARVVAGPDGPRLEPNPARLGTDDSAFLLDEERGYQATRKPLVGEFTVGGRTLFVINVHLKSKRGDDALFGAGQPPVAHSEVQRLDQVRSVGALVDSLLRRDPCAAVVVLGDFNDADDSRPVRALREHRLTNLLERVPLGERYTYVFEGLSQSLDHVLVSPALTDVADVRIVHGNADAPYRGRSSDHDPVWARLRLDAVGECDPGL